jgi:hypothetical protein
MGDRVEDLHGIPVQEGFGSYNDLVQIAPNYLNYRGIYTDAARALVAQTKGKIERGVVPVPELSHSGTPNQEITRKTKEGDLTIHFDTKGLPASADLSYDYKHHKIREHVTVAGGKIMADDLYDNSQIVSHLGFDAAHRVREATSLANIPDAFLLGFQFDEHGKLTHAHEVKAEGDIIDFYDEGNSRKIVTANPNDDKDIDTYHYDLRRGKLTELDIDKGNGTEVQVKPKPDGSLDIKTGQKT